MLERSFAILGAFQAGDGELTLAELSRRTGLPKATAHRLLGELETLGAVERTPGGVRLGLRLFELGQLVPRPRDLLDVAAPFLSDLREATHQTVHLAVLDGVEVVYVQKLGGHRGPEIPSRLGGRMPAYCTAVGKALLAFAVPGVVDVVLGGSLPRRTPRTVVAPGLIRAELASVRRRGVAEEHEESAAGIACVAAPVLSPGGTAVAAVSITGWAGRLDVRRLAPTVRAAALGVGRLL
ncbi:IclR family transcriptional regulator [Cryptosporangium phraense]|uniref:IclR family transcriptional regulator n=1 Tax=Cryptosporangium phraense TaxID=2593070 RepID=A0A545AVU2_9ACTN|nr:IclR family transcriptional regulator [Cryptosporangium phraense]TQS45462.1 IclR family transcriptional regulator [Cryptosporangium phraense]